MHIFLDKHTLIHPERLWQGLTRKVWKNSDSDHLFV